MTLSRRLRVLNFGMRWLVKPRLRRSRTPEKVNRSFERAAPFLFAHPKGYVSNKTAHAAASPLARHCPTALFCIYMAAPLSLDRSAAIADFAAD
jgi:hypothetical protein